MSVLVFAFFTAPVFAQEGTLDVSFVHGPGVNGPVYALALQTDGKLLAGGDFDTFNEISHPGIVRLNANGTCDESFQASVTTGSGGVLAIAVQTDGKILLGGDFDLVGDADKPFLARLTATGELDTGFNTITDSLVRRIIVSSSGIFVGGDFGTLTRSSTDTIRNYIAKLSSTGVIANWNNPGVDEWDGPDGSVYAMAVQRDGNILIGGDFSTISHGEEELDRFGVASLTSAQGMNSPLFNPALGANGPVYSIVVQPDGKVLVTGDFTTFNGAVRSGIARLNSNGSLDSTFGPGTGVNGPVYAAALQADGRILIGGDFTAVDGATHYSLARLNGNGSLDTSFRTGESIADGAVYAIQVLVDGQILVAGSFSSVSGRDLRGLVRINGPQAPSLTAQPQGQVTTEGSTVQFSVSAVGRGTLSYQWYKGDFALSDGDRISGSKTPILTLKSTAPGDESGYSVVVDNSAGSVSSRKAQLDVTARPPLAMRLGLLKLSSDLLRLQLTDGPAPCIIQSSTNLSDWTSLLTNVNSTTSFIDVPCDSAGAERYFRAIAIGN